IADTCGNPLDGNRDGTGGDSYTWSFTTGTDSNCPPTITSMDSSGYYETTLTITGINFTNNIQEVNFFDGTNADSHCLSAEFLPDAPCFSSWTNTEIKVQIPAASGLTNGAADGPVQVMVGGVGSNTKNLDVRAPRIISLDPSEGAPGRAITISGENFGGTNGTVWFRKPGGANIQGQPTNCVDWWKDDQIIISVPEGFNVGDDVWVQVETSGAKRSNIYSYFTMSNVTGPTLCGLDPTCGSEGDSVDLDGSGFGSAPGRVYFDTTVAATSAWSDTSITSQVPAVSDGSPIVKAYNNGYSNGLMFEKPCEGGGGPGDGCSSSPTSCIPESANCGAGLFCNPSCVCESGGGPGAGCSSSPTSCIPESANCGAGLFCNPSCVCESGGGPGAGCSSSPTSCVPESANCSAGLFCNNSCVCEAGGGPGESCDGEPGILGCQANPSACAEGNYCDNDTCLCAEATPCDSTPETPTCEPDNAACTAPQECDPGDCYCKPLPNFGCSLDEWTCDPAATACGAQACNNSCQCVDRPTIVTRIPTGADICRNSIIDVTFSQAMRQSTINNTTFELVVGAAADGEACADNTDCKSGVCENNVCQGNYVDGTFTYYNGNKSFRYHPSLLLRNATYHVKVTGGASGVLNQDGISMAGDEAWQFTTADSDNICEITKVLIDPNYHLFTQKDTAQEYLAQAYYHTQPIDPIPTVYEWTWSWQSEDASIIGIPGSTTNQETGTVDNKNGETYVDAMATVTTPGKEKTVIGKSTVEVKLCEKPWPIENWPYADNELNYSTWYCLDGGLPAFTSVVPAADVPGVLGEVFFTGLKVCAGTSTDCSVNPEICPAEKPCTVLEDAIGVRIMPNVDKYSPELWFKKTLPNETADNINEEKTDSYPSIRIGRSTYVGATNLSGGSLYANMYIISYDDKAGDITKDIYREMVKNLRFNINLDLADKELLAKDMSRIGRLHDLREIINKYYGANLKYPKLEVGSYLPERSTSAWPSWQATLGNQLGKSLPVDPLNAFNVDFCPTAAGFDQSTCWDEEEAVGEYGDEGGKFMCRPTSNILMYKFIPGANPNDPGSVELYCNFEYTGQGNWANASANPCSDTEFSQCDCFNYLETITP
ncbi:MAG: IPT/TIG domain-containing protein, partial [Patescibacteria group bacterium]|nr:IPT/TIG domain-containing protein [Patescibacteria group bacterium]